MAGPPYLPNLSGLSLAPTAPTDRPGQRDQQHLEERAARHQAAQRTRSDVLDNDDLVRAILEAIDASDAEAACAAAQGGCDASYPHREACLGASDAMWDALSERAFGLVPVQLEGEVQPDYAAKEYTTYANQAGGKARFQEDRTTYADQAGGRTNFYNLCHRVRAYRTGRRRLVWIPKEGWSQDFNESEPEEGLQFLDGTVKAFVLAAVRFNGYELRYASNALRKDSDVALAAITNQTGPMDGIGNRASVLRYVLPENEAYQEVAFAAVNQDGMALEWFTAQPLATRTAYQLWLDNHIVIAAVKQRPGWGQPGYEGEDPLRSPLRWASFEFKDSRLPMRKVVDHDPRLLRWASWGVLFDKKIMLSAVQRVGMLLRYAPDQVRSDKKVVLAAVQQDGEALLYASRELKEDREIVDAAVQRDGEALRWAANRYSDVKKVVLLAVKSTPSILPTVSMRLRDDKKVVLTALRRGQGILLQHASIRLRDDKEVVLAAVRTDGNALKYASVRLQGNPEVLAARDTGND